MKISLLMNILFPGNNYHAVAYPIQTAMNVYWGISNNGHLVQLVNASDPVDKIISRLKSFQPDLIFNLAEGLTHSPTRLAFFPELFERLQIPYIGGDGHLLTLSLNKYMTKTVLSDIGIKTPKGNLYHLNSQNKCKKIGNWKETFPVITKPNFRGDSEGIDQKSVVYNRKDLKKILNERLIMYPEGFLVEEFIPGREIEVSFLPGKGEKNILFPIELIISKKSNNPHNIIDYKLKNYAIGSNTCRFLSIRLAKSLSIKMIKRIENIARECFEIFQVKDFGRIDMRVTDKGEIYILELTPDIAMKDETPMFYSAKKMHGMTYEAVLNQIIKNAANLWGIKYYQSNIGLFSSLIYKLRCKYHIFRYGNMRYFDKNA